MKWIKLSDKMINLEMTFKIQTTQGGVYFHDKNMKPVEVINCKNLEESKELLKLIDQHIESTNITLDLS